MIAYAASTLFAACLVASPIALGAAWPAVRREHARRARRMSR